MKGWIRTMPRSRLIDLIVVHCSDSDYGNAVLIDRWHRARGWRSIGYHYVILNGYPDEDSSRLHRPQFWLDGFIEAGRQVERIGAHVRGWNHNSIGICMIGRNQFTQLQFEALQKLIADIRRSHRDARLCGHYELLRPGDPPKTCPNIDMEWLRGLMV